MLPCYSNGDEFVIWFNIYKSFNSIKFNVFARASEAVQVDRIGRNALASYQHESFVYLMSSSVSSKETITFSQLDVSRIESKYVGEQVIKVFTNSDFEIYTKDGAVINIEKQFNIRDIKIYSIIPSDSISQEISHNIIISCYNNGLIFMQATRPEEIANYAK